LSSVLSFVFFFVFFVFFFFSTTTRVVLIRVLVWIVVYWRKWREKFVIFSSPHLINKEK